MTTESQEKNDSSERIFSPNTSQIPNVIFDYWMGILSPSEFKVLMCICRKTFGWHKDSDRISRAQIVKMTGLSRDNVRKSLSMLEEIGLIKKFEQFNSQGDNDPNLYEIHVHDEKKPGVGLEKAQGWALEKPRGGLKLSPTKETNTKETNTKYICTSEEPEVKKNTPLLSDVVKKKTKTSPFRTASLVERAADHEDYALFVEHFQSMLVGVSDQSHQELVAQYGETTVKKAYDAFASWKISKAECDPKALKVHTDTNRIKTWVIKKILENPNASLVGGYKRTGKLAIEADKRVESVEDRPKVWTEHELETKISHKFLKRIFGIKDEDLNEEDQQTLAYVRKKGYDKTFNIEEVVE